MKINSNYLKKITLRHLFHYSQIMLWAFSALAFVYTSWFLYQQVYLTFTEPDNPEMLTAPAAFSSPIELKTDKFNEVIKKLDKKTQKKPAIFLRDIF